MELAEETQQISDAQVKDAVDSEKEEREQNAKDQDHDPGRDRFLAGRPVDL